MEQEVEFSLIIGFIYIGFGFTLASYKNNEPYQRKVWGLFLGPKWPFITAHYTPQMVE